MTYDEAFGQSIIGCTIVVGFNRARTDGTLIEKAQDHGTILESTEEDGIVIQKLDGSTFTIPPDHSALRIAEPGIYTLRATKEQVINPVYTSEWTIWEADTDSPSWSPEYKR
jgi:hypothetical protein